MEASNSSRRTFYTVVIGGLGAVITAALALPTAVYLLFKPKTADKGAWVPAIGVTQLAIKKPQEVVFERKRVDGWRAENQKSTAWVVRMDEQHVVAFTPLCTHLSCAYHWDDAKNEFICPCHGSIFSIDGKVLAGPAPRPLDRYVSKVEGAQLLIGPGIERG